MLKPLIHGCILLLSTVILSGCGELGSLILGAETLYSKKTEPLTPTSNSSEALRQELFGLTNLERAKVNLPALVLSSALNHAAQTHAEDMATGDFLDHQGSDQSDAADRVKRVNYPHSYRGENIAYNSSNAQGAIEQWMSTTDHRKNILDEYTNEIGIGYAISKTSGRHYYVQVFGETARPALPLPSNLPTEVSWAGDPTVSEMAEAIRDHPGSRAKDIITSLEIAQAAKSASAQFGLAPRQLLAVWAHESQFGHTRSEGNGAGLGQLTRPAVAELQRIGKGGRDGNRRGTSDATYAMIRAPQARIVFDRLDSFASLISIEDNAIGSAAYLRLMLDVHDGDQISALRAYNGSGGAIEAAYPGRVSDAHQALFGRPLPAILERR
jgi:hypothetical protein